MILLDRRYRVLADVVVGVWTLPRLEDTDAGKPERATNSWQSDAQAFARENLAAQERLLEGLVRDAPVLEAWLRRESVRHVLDCGLDGFRIDTPEEELLAPVIATLPPPDREFFQEAVANDTFCEWADPFLNSVSAKLIEISVTERSQTSLKSMYALVLKEYRVAIDLRVELHEIDPAEAERSWLLLPERCGCELEIAAERYVGVQTSLLATLRSCEEELDLWLKQEVFRELVDYGDEPSIPELGDQEILTPVIAGLKPADRARFECLLEDGTLYEGARAFYRAVGASTREVSIAEVPATRTTRWR